MNKVKVCKHKFQPRYTEIYSNVIKDILAHSELLTGKGKFEAAGSEPYLQEKRYIHDICVKCGEIRK